MLKIALPKGRLGNDVYDLFARVGYSCPSLLEDNRKLIFHNDDNDITYLLVKPTDVAVYVEHGAADVGVVGLDTLEEGGADVYHLLNLGFGKCRMAVAARKDYFEDTDRVLRVATKYPNIAKAHYGALNREIELIKLNGSIELAPLMGLSDVIVDIVESGNTIRENNLKVCEEFMQISAHLIANKASFKFKEKAIRQMIEKLSAEIKV